MFRTRFNMSGQASWYVYASFILKNILCVKVESETTIQYFYYFSEQVTFIIKLVHLQTSQRLFSRQGALIKFVNGSMMVSTETPYATANQMIATQLKLWRVGYKMEVYVSFSSLFSSQCSVFIKHFVMILISSTTLYRILKHRLICQN